MYEEMFGEFLRDTAGMYLAGKITQEEAVTIIENAIADSRPAQILLEQEVLRFQREATTTAAG